MLLVMLALANAAAVPPAPYPLRTTANGYGVAVYDGDAGRVSRWHDRIYQQRSPTDPPVRDLLYDAYFGLRVDGVGAWLADAAPGVYEPGTHIVQVTRPAADLTVTERLLAPLTLARPALVQVLEVQVTGADAVSLDVYSLVNLHLGDSTWESERLAWDGSAVVEQGNNTGLAVVTVPLVAPTKVGCSPDNPYAALLAAEDLSGTCDAAGDDLVSGFQWGSGTLEPGQALTVGVVHAFATTAELDAVRAEVEAWIRPPLELLANERAAAAGLLARARLPAGLSADREAVLRQALLTLLTGQVREPDDAYGQLPASLTASAPVGSFQHVWNITWVRDSVYAIVALAEAGYVEEAQAGLDFLLQPGKSGAWKDYVQGLDYAVSVCRTYGDGTEWSDVDADGPNIEFDGFGLVLWAAGRIVANGGDEAWLRGHRDALFDGLADVLVGLVDPATGLLRPDSSIWEEHWNGRQQAFAYSSVTAARGLREAAGLADLLGDARAGTWRSAADGLALAIVEELVTEEGVVASSREQRLRGEGVLDAAAVEAFNLGVLDGQSDVALQSLDAWDAGLRVATGPGYRRNDDGDLYDLQEWIWADLRLAEAWRRACRPERSEELVDWVTARAREGGDLVPELLDPDTAAFAGPAPMMGFGAGLYALTLLGVEAADADCATGPEVPGNPEPTTTGPTGTGPTTEPTTTGSSPTAPVDGDPEGAAPGGCGCGGASPGGAMVGVGALLALLRRRR